MNSEKSKTFDPHRESFIGYPLATKPHQNVPFSRKLHRYQKSNS